MTHSERLLDMLLVSFWFTSSSVFVNTHIHTKPLTLLAGHCLYRFLLLAVQAYMGHLITTDDASCFDVVLTQPPLISLSTRSGKLMLFWKATAVVMVVNLICNITTNKRHMLETN